MAYEGGTRNAREIKESIGTFGSYSSPGCDVGRGKGDVGQHDRRREGEAGLLTIRSRLLPFQSVTKPQRLQVLEQPVLYRSRVVPHDCVAVQRTNQKSSGATPIFHAHPGAITWMI